MKIIRNEKNKRLDIICDNNKQFKWMRRLLKLNRIHKKATCNFDQETKTTNISFNDKEEYYKFTEPFIKEMQHAMACAQEKGMVFSIEIK